MRNKAMNVSGRKQGKGRVRLKLFMRQLVTNSRRNRAYKRKWLNQAKKVEDFERHLGKAIYTDSFSAQFMDDFLYYLRSQPKNYKASTIRSFGQKIGEAVRKAARDGYKVDWGFEEIELPNEDTCAIYLTMDEIERIFKLKSISREAHNVRERFVIACLTGMRFSDVSKITEENIIEGIAIIMRTRKTKARVEVPMHWLVKEIFKRNKGVLPPLKSQQAFNTMVKRICRKAGITGKVLYEQTEGLKMVRKNVPKWSLVSSHTGRRSFATHMYLAGIPIARIMLITGHTTEQAFFKYIRINRTENAKILSEHPFFKGSSK